MIKEKYHKTFVDLAFCMGFPDLIWVTSSTQNISVAKKRNWGLKQKPALEKCFCLIISVILQNTRIIS